MRQLLLLSLRRQKTNRPDLFENALHPPAWHGCVHGYIIISRSEDSHKSGDAVRRALCRHGHRPADVAVPAGEICARRPCGPRKLRKSICLLLIGKSRLVRILHCRFLQIFINVFAVIHFSSPSQVSLQKKETCRKQIINYIIIEKRLP